MIHQESACTLLLVLIESPKSTNNMNNPSVWGKVIKKVKQAIIYKVPKVVAVI